MARSIRMLDGRFEAAERALARAREEQYRQLRIVFNGAGLPAHSLAWGHATLSNEALAKLINYVSSYKVQVKTVNPHAYGLED